jgi:hypothetical protein
MKCVLLMTEERRLSELPFNRITATKLLALKFLRELSAGKRVSSAKQTSPTDFF